MPAEAGEAVEEAELEEVADAEVGDGSEVARQFVVFRLAGVLECASDGLLRFALDVAAMFLLPPIKRVEVVVPCRISPPMNFRSSVNSSAPTFSSIPSRFAVSHATDSGVKYSSASSRIIQFASIFRLSSAQLNCTDCSPGHSCSTKIGG